MIQDSIERSVEIDASPEDVWSIITEAEYVAQWFGDKAEIDLRPGGAASFTWTEHDHTARARVEAVAPPNLFAFRWSNTGLPVADDVELDETNSTLVEFRLTPSGDGTTLQVTESGFAKLDQPEEVVSASVENHTDGWVVEIDKLVAFANQRAAV